MAARVDLPRTLIASALELKQASIKRANNNEKNPVIKEARDKEIADYQHAINTITEIK